jgi:quercetin dioxygenase-like cupin family protein
MILALLLVLANAPIAFTSEAIVWKDGPPSLPAGAKLAVLEGDPREKGMFTIRVRVPAGAKLAPHWHPRDERVTLLSGAAELGFGSTAERSATKRYDAGSFYVNPPRAMHYLYFPEETVMQMTGEGPWELFTTQAPDTQ